MFPNTCPKGDYQVETPPGLLNGMVTIPLILMHQLLNITNITIILCPPILEIYKIKRWYSHFSAVELCICTNFCKYYI
ncbi:hypothetical protein SORBI_3010G136700 [Sorghum bicolor]|nr:hypothetical protein SORBI_3010G136700 [Sorghum bicolor]